jgi:nucleotide-binding universal stress UspA family protein
MRSILVQAGRDPEFPIRLDAALAIARATGGHVTALVDTPIEGFVTTDPFGGTYVAREALAAALASDDLLAADVAERLKSSDVPFDVVQYEMYPVDALATAARLADLVIVSRSSGLAGDLALASPCPVLALPHRDGWSLPLERACVAWDGGDEAAEALRGAIPLLTGCPNVSVLTVTRESPKGFPPTEALRYLSRHGIKADLVELVEGDSVEETLAAAIAERGAQLLVMGAYGHGRVREFLFGGVTRFFVDELAAPPLLLAH